MISTNHSFHEVLRKGDKVAVGNMTERNISVLTKENDIVMVGGWFAGKGGQSIEVSRKKIPIFNTFEELLRSLSIPQKPNKIVLFLPKNNILAYIKEVIVVGKGYVKTVVIVSEYITQQKYLNIYRMCRYANMDVSIINPSNLDTNQYYAMQDGEQMPWFYKQLDPDVEEALQERGIVEGHFLDVGTGAGIQAIELAKRGFQVTATDRIAHAFGKAALEWQRVEFVKDDILHSRLERQFDYILDRGCFHVIASEDRQRYIEHIARLLKPNGLLFIKCFSNKNLFPKDAKQPYLFSKRNIEEFFRGYLKIEKIKETVFNGNNEVDPKAFFVILRK